MSVRNMLKVVMSLWLAMTIAATADTQAARVDQSPASISAAGKLNDKIPYLLCQRICIGACICDKRAPEFAECICSRAGDSSDSNKPAALLHTSEETLQVKGKSENSGLIPYAECMKTCSKCACTRKWPPESNMCFCFKDDSVTKKAAVVADRLDHSFASVIEETLQVKGKLEQQDLIPYTECMKTCSKCACTRKWPLESNMCFCFKVDSVTKKAATVADRLDHLFTSITEKANELYENLDLFVGPVPKRIGGDYKKMVLWTTSKMEATIPYTECIKTCETCACTLIWPPERAICICVTPKPQAIGGKAVAK